MSYEPVKLKQKISVNKIYTIHYFEYMSNFYFPGEQHDFWEVVCVDKGEVIVNANHQEYILTKGNVIFHKPNEFHSVRTNGHNSCNMVVISFECNAYYMKYFEDRIFQVSDLEKVLFSDIIMEAKQTYENSLGDPYYEKLIRKREAPFGAEQLIKLYLEHILIGLYRRYYTTNTYTDSFKIINNSTQSKLYKQIEEYLQTNISRKLTVEDICNENLISRSMLQSLIKTQHNCSVIDYYTHLKIEKSKQLIRDNKMNFSEIADQVGYSSIHYFSRQFKKVTGMTPSQYASSIKSLTDNAYTNYKIT